MTKSAQEKKNPKKAKTSRRVSQTKIKNSVKGRKIGPNWPVVMAWIGYALVALFLLMLGPGSLILSYMIVADKATQQAISAGLMALVGTLCLVGLVLEVVSAVQAYRRAGERMREVMTLVGGSAVGVLIGIWLMFALPFKSPESYVILYALVALLPAAVAAMFHWLLPTGEQRPGLQKTALVIALILIAVELVVGGVTVVKMVQAMVDTTAAPETVEEAQVIETEAGTETESGAEIETETEAGAEVEVGTETETTGENQ